MKDHYGLVPLFSLPVASGYLLNEYCLSHALPSSVKLQMGRALFKQFVSQYRKAP